MIALCLLLTGCGGGETAQTDLAQTLREEYAAVTTWSGTAQVTADYGQRVYQYTLEGVGTEGAVTLTVTAPAEVAGVSARIADGQTRLEYDGAMLETGPLSPEGLSPVSAMPALLDYARAGFSDQWSEEEGLLRVDYRDPDNDPGSGTEAVLWFDPASHDLVRGEITVDGYRVILCQWTAFSRQTGAEG
jgi:hypothetical protein